MWPAGGGAVASVEEGELSVVLGMGVEVVRALGIGVSVVFSGCSVVVMTVVVLGVSVEVVVTLTSCGVVVVVVVVGVVVGGVVVVVVVVSVVVVVGGVSVVGSVVSGGSVVFCGGVMVTLLGSGEAGGESVMGSATSLSGRDVVCILVVLGGKDVVVRVEGDVVRGVVGVWVPPLCCGRVCAASGEAMRLVARITST